MIERKTLAGYARLADKFWLDVGGLRILFVTATVLGLGSPVFIYLILYLLKPSTY